jgi:hypothetical protein
VRTLHGGQGLELRGGESRDGMRTKPALVIVQGSERVRVEMADVKLVHSASLRDGTVAAMGDAAADLAGVLAGS